MRRLRAHALLRAWAPERGVGVIPDPQGVVDQIFALAGRPRLFRVCRTCHDIGMIESGNQEDVCPECEGGIWRERESWRWFFHRQSWLGLRIDLLHHRVPRITKDRPA